METQIKQQLERSVTLSLADKDYSGKTVTYLPKDINIGSIESILKQHNYSPITWYTNYRLAANFKSASGFCVDSDNGMTIEQALEKLQQLGWNYFLITTRRHKSEAHRFRIYIPFSKNVYSYKLYQAVIATICKEFPQSDESVLDGARQLYGSPEDATYHSHWDGKDYDVDSFFKDGEWDDNLRILDKNNKQLDYRTIKEKTQILCPFHNDSNASAFIEYCKQSNNYFIHCSTCQHTFWMIKEPASMEEKCRGFYSLGSGFHQLSITRGEFSMIEIGEKKVHTLIGASSKKEKDHIYEWLVKKQHFANMNLVEQVGEIDAKRSYYEPIIEDGMVRVHHGAIKVMEQNNDLIEQYFTQTFGQYKDCIKQWLAVFCYTNYRKLPFLILTGERGSGKNTFAELIGEIYKPLTMSWSGMPGQFTPEYEKKLLIADETVTEDHEQYLELKRLSGLKDLPVNKKHQQHYQVRNNINVIILSNAPYPIQVERDEVPKNDNENQFFVYKMKKNYTTPDAKYGEKLKNYIGHYVRTELKKVFESLDIDKYRYSIPVPITEYEKDLFASSVTQEEDVMDKILLKMKDFYNNNSSVYYAFLNQGSIPLDLLEDYIGTIKVSKSRMLKLFRTYGYISADGISRITINQDRRYCYTATSKLTDYMKL